MKELENGKKKLLITGMILIIIAVCTAGIFAYGSHKNNQKAAAKVQEESVQRASQEQSLRHKKSRNRKPGVLPRQNCRRHFPRHRAVMNP